MASRTLEVCLYFGGCRHCLTPIEGTWGVTAKPVCASPAGRQCQLREDWRKAGMVQICPAAGQAVAGFRSDALMRAAPKELYDVLPAIAPEEWGILYQFAVDYTRRRIPWMVVSSGMCFALVKRKVV